MAPRPEPPAPSSPTGLLSTSTGSSRRSALKYLGGLGEVVELTTHPIEPLRARMTPGLGQENLVVERAEDRAQFLEGGGGSIRRAGRRVAPMRPIDAAEGDELLCLPLVPRGQQLVVFAGGR